MKMNEKYFTNKESNGLISSEDVVCLAEFLESGAVLDSASVFDLVWILSKHGSEKYCSTLERYLLSKSDVMLVRLVLETLCLRWQCGEHYEKYVLGFMDKSLWDCEEDVRVMALSCAGYLWRKTKNIHLLEKLLSIFDDKNENEFIRVVAYQAIVRALSEGEDDIPSCLGFDLLNGVDKKIVSKARKEIV